MTTTASDVDALIAAAEAAADVAGAIIRPFFRAAPSVRTKDDRSPVTIADRTAELAMRAVISERFSSHGIIGEEFGTVGADARVRWVLDPIDGTRAFITGRPVFGTLIAVLLDGRPLLGVIDQPVTGERWIGVTGHRTSFRGPFGGAVGTRACSLSEAELSCTSPEMFGADADPFWRLSRAVRRTTFGGDCYAYGLLALGQLDVIVEADLKLWDWAALVPVIEGAGGCVTDWTGASLREGGDGRVLAVGDASLMAQATSLLSLSGTGA